MMMFAFNLMTSSGPEVEWSRPLMIAWLALVLALSVIEMFWPRRKISPAKAQRRKESPGKHGSALRLCVKNHPSSYATSFFCSAGRGEAGFRASSLSSAAW